MAMIGTTIFSHIIPAVLGFFAIILLISGSIDDSNTKLSIGVIMFVIACATPYVVLSYLL